MPDQDLPILRQQGPTISSFDGFPCQYNQNIAQILFDMFHQNYCKQAKKHLG
jgi:hypothetical protein